MKSVDLTPVGGGVLLFMHIPKTGGTSMRKAVGDAYESSERAFIYEEGGVRGSLKRRAFAKLPSEERARVRLAFGHYPYGLHSSVPGDSAYVAVVRDPVDRVISVYDHYRHHKGVRYALMSSTARSRDRAAMERAEIEQSGLDLESWIFERMPTEVDNQMVRQIAGAPTIPFGECGDDLLATALEHIEQRFEMLMLQDELPAGLTRLSSRIGRPLTSGHRLKVNRRRQPIDAVEKRVRDRIADLNRLDTQLYAFARARQTEMMSGRD